ncbi:ABC transporter ATP-binding protein [Aurantiacibacter luteus]|uniref:Ferrichrome ABC transporter ATP-binding protein n=1 Tax=Aurantiacibacter luteus TaxID=1581420 RepID=A0A0G9MYM7_9SPHN|nr:ABC transporter ATP-binding protein [Aurantiacibacter luteus]KLE35846.1 ferrichrome ABC transporter ATP-binding protein [Aurantiacibacter luteus]
MSLVAKDVALAGRLAGVSAALEPGRITAICGPNGAGKSTLLSVLAGLLAPDTGVARLGERALSSLPPRERARAIGYLPQTGEVAWDVSVSNLVALGRLPHGDKGDEAVARALGSCDLDAFAARPVSTLSGGERARALLARVLAGEPEWILADEPFAALDIGHQLALLRVLRAEAKARRGVVIVVHDLTIAMNHADRVLVLDDGALAADGSPDEALSDEIIARVWGVTARWTGEPQARALVVHG